MSPPAAETVTELKLRLRLSGIVTLDSLIANWCLQPTSPISYVVHTYEAIGDRKLRAHGAEAAVTVVTDRACVYAAAQPVPHQESLQTSFH